MDERLLRNKINTQYSRESRTLMIDGEQMVVRGIFKKGFINWLYQHHEQLAKIAAEQSPLVRESLRHVPWGQALDDQNYKDYQHCLRAMQIIKDLLAQAKLQHSS